jgi:hypothetical protein
VQRCQFHVKMNAKVKLTSNPKTDAGKELWKLVNGIFTVDNLEKKNEWILNLNEWFKKHNETMYEKTFSKNNQTNSKRKWWYTHKKLRSCYFQLFKLVQSNNLFIFLDEARFKVPNTSNLIEGKINKEIKRLNRCHCGMSQFHTLKFVELFLFMKSEFGKI